MQQFNQTLLSRIKELSGLKKTIKEEIDSMESEAKRIQAESPRKMWQYDVVNGQLTELCLLAKEMKVRVPKKYKG